MKVYDRVKAALAGKVVAHSDYDQVVAERDALKAELAEIEAYIGTVQGEREEAVEQAAQAVEQVAQAQAQVAQVEQAAQAVQANATATLNAIADAGLPADAIKQTAPATREQLLAEMTKLRTVAERQAFSDLHKQVLSGTPESPAQG